MRIAIECSIGDSIHKTYHQPRHHKNSYTQETIHEYTRKMAAKSLDGLESFENSSQLAHRSFSRRVHGTVIVDDCQGPDNTISHHEATKRPRDSLIRVEIDALVRRNIHLESWSGINEGYTSRLQVRGAVKLHAIAFVSRENGPPRTWDLVGLS